MPEPPVDPNLVQYNVTDSSKEATTKSNNLAGKHFVLDIGHGNNNTMPAVYDPGACSHGYEEHKLVEGLVTEIARLLRLEGANVTVIHDIALRKRRCDKYASGNSFHMNAGGGTGVEVWIPLLASARAKKKADAIGDRIAHVMGIPYRGTKRTARLAVLNRGFDRLIECGFIDNAADRNKFIERKRLIAGAFVAEFL